MAATARRHPRRAALADAASESLQYLVAITVGLFPAETLKRWLLWKTAGIRPKVEEDPPPLRFLQGMPEDIQATLREERIERIQHLAYRNPYQILLRCNLEWSTIIHFVGQALLVQYVGAKIESLRMIGIRGAIDMTAVYDRVVSSLEDMKEADPVLRRIGEILGENEQIARNIGYTLWTDPVVQFLWEHNGMQALQMATRRMWTSCFRRPVWCGDAMLACLSVNLSPRSPGGCVSGCTAGDDFSGDSQGVVSSAGW